MSLCQTLRSSQQVLAPARDGALSAEFESGSRLSKGRCKSSLVSTGKRNLDPNGREASQIQTARVHLPPS